MSELLTTDDAARRLEFKWKGEPGSPMPFEARYSAIGAALILAVVFWCVTVAVTSIMYPLGVQPLLAAVIQFVAAGGVATVLPVLVVRKISRHVTKDQPWAHHWRVFLAERATPRMPPARTTVVSAQHIVYPASTTRVVDVHIARGGRLRAAAPTQGAAS